VAIVTGAGSGIGLATATAFAREGCRVALVGRRREPLDELAAALTGEGAECLALPADVSDQAAVVRVVEQVLERWQRIDVVVNNAGLNVPRREVGTVSADDWATVLDVNLTGTFFMTQAALPTMRAQRSGTVLNVSSIAGYRAMALTGPAYSAAKAAVNSFTESLNLTERVHGIRASAVCPGEVATPILDKRPVPPSAEARASMLQPEDLAATLLFLATLPQRATVELVTMFPTTQRDWSEEVG
jgi:NADP-dependent 3-hydroxy acid dehydrogenase YdfG